MSEEVLRSYPARITGARGLRLGRRRRPWVRYAFLSIVIGVPLYAWWVTRDTYPMGALIPKEQNYTLIFPDLIQGRNRIAQTSLWDALPPGHELRGMQAQLQNDFGLPEWLVNNIVAGVVHVSGRDVAGLTDAVLVTRMTRFGTLLERYRGWIDLIETDFAGGLQLHHVKPASLYYAVRGRVVVASRDRNALVQALVLTPDDALGEEGFEEAISGTKDELIEFRARPEQWPEAAQYLDGAEARVWLDEGAARIRMAGRLNAATRELYSSVLANARPVALPATLPGALALSVNLGVPAAESWGELGKLFGATMDPAAAVSGLLVESAQPVAGPVLASALERLGDGWSVTYRGLNPMAFLPLPRLAALFSCDTAWADEWIRSVPAPPEEVQAWESWPRVGGEGRYLHLPLVGGPELEPTVATYGSRLLLASSMNDAQELLAAPQPKPIELTGNVLLTILPGALLDDVQEVAAQLAQMGLIRNHTPASVPDLITPWRETAAGITRASLLLAHEDGVVTADLYLDLKPSQEVVAAE